MGEGVGSYFWENQKLSVDDDEEDEMGESEREIKLQWLSGGF